LAVVAAVTATVAATTIDATAAVAAATAIAAATSVIEDAKQLFLEKGLACQQHHRARITLVPFWSETKTNRAVGT
jgi:hypothetical protein